MTDDSPESPLSDLTRDQIERRLQRERAAREEAERVLEERSRELWRANQQLAERESVLVRHLEERNRHLLTAQRTARIATIYRARSAKPTFSPEFRRLLGLSEGEPATPDRLMAAIHPLDRARVMEEERSFYRAGGRQTKFAHEHRILWPDGQARWVRWILERENGPDGSFLSLFGTVQDITEERTGQRKVKALQLLEARRVRHLTRLGSELAASRAEAERAFRARNDFLAMMSHEVRTPLNGLIGVFDLLADDAGISPENRHRVDLARSAATQLHQHLVAVVEMARGNGNLPFVPEAVDIRASFHGIMSFWQGLLPEVGQRMRLNVQDQAPQTVSTDPVRLRQLVDGMLERAAGAAGPLTIDVAAEGADIVISVLSEPVEVRETSEVLERLAASMQAVMVWGAESDVLRQVLTLPVAPRGADIPHPRREHRGAGTQKTLTIGGRRPYILIADDIELNRLVLAGMLEALGCGYDFAEDGVQAVERVMRGAFDAVLMDIRMPRLSGVEAALSIRHDAPPGTRDIPIIAITAHALKAELDQMLEQGMTAALAKPIDRRDLAATLMSALGIDPPESPASSPSIVPPDDRPAIVAETFLAVLAPLDAQRRRLIINAAISDLGSLGTALHAATDRHDEAAYDRAIHSLKGVAGNIGAMRLHEATVAMRNLEPHAKFDLLDFIESEIAGVIRHARDLVTRL